MPSSMSRASTLTKLRQACVVPPSAVFSHPCQPALLHSTVVFHAGHKEDVDGVPHDHYHIAVEGVSSFHFAPVKEAMQERVIDFQTS